MQQWSVSALCPGDREQGRDNSSNCCPACQHQQLQSAYPCSCRKEPHQVQHISMSGWKQRTGVWGQQRRGRSNQLPVLSRPEHCRQPGLDRPRLQGGPAWPQVNCGCITHRAHSIYIVSVLIMLLLAARTLLCAGGGTPHLCTTDSCSSMAALMADRM